MRIRQLQIADLPQLTLLDPNYVAHSELSIEREQDGLNVTFRLVERERAKPYVKREGYSFNLSYQRDLHQRITAGKGLYLAAENEDGRLIGFLDLDIDSWRPVASLQWVIVDRPWRGQGVGRLLMQQALDWTRMMGLRAIILETQNTNIDACRFYLRLGFRISGLQDPFYFNDLVAEERAIFWVYEM